MLSPTFRVTIPKGGNTAVTVKYGLFRNRKFTIYNDRHEGEGSRIEIKYNSATVASCFLGWMGERIGVTSSFMSPTWSFPKNNVIRLNKAQYGESMNHSFPVAQMDQRVYIAVNKETGEADVAAWPTNLDGWVSPTQTQKETTSVILGIIMLIMFF